MLLKVRRYVSIIILVAILIASHYGYVIYAENDVSSDNSVIQFYCKGDDLILSVSFNADSDFTHTPNIHADVLSEKGFSHYDLHPIRQDILDTFVKTTSVVGKCSGSYLIAINMSGISHGGYKIYYVRSEENKILTTREEHFLSSSFYVVGNITTTTGVVSYDIYYENATTTTVALSFEDVSNIIVQVYSDDYVLYNSVYDKDHKYFHIAIKRGKDIMVPPHTARKVATINIPLLERRIRSINNIVFFIASGREYGAYLRLPVVFRHQWKTLPQWAKPFVEGFQKIGVIPWKQLDKSASRCDIVALLAVNLKGFKGSLCSTSLSPLSGLAYCNASLSAECLRGWSCAVLGSNSLL